MAGKTVTTEERISRVGQRRQVVIPREMLETLHLKEGDFVAIAKAREGCPH
jgi:bifunctional DNA-binding transcriptional regulator/antitoxin component of YhaV-PrlF toxin-antitoxin module